MEIVTSFPQFPPAEVTALVFPQAASVSILTEQLPSITFEAARAAKSYII